MLRSPLLHFMLIGALLFGLQRIGSVVPEASIVEVRRSQIDEGIAAYQKQMGREATSDEARSIENQAIENALWLEQAWGLGLHRTDPIVRQRLILNMRFLEGESDASEDELVRQAIELGMDRSDTVVQRRLVDRIQAMIRAGVRSRSADDVILRKHYENTASRWREPILLDLTHVYFSRDKRGEATWANAAAMLQKLTEERIDPVAAIVLADSFLSGHQLRGANPNRIVARLGPTFAAGVEDAEILRWVGPVESAFGAHLVWIHERIASRIPPFDEVRRRVLDDWIEQETRRALRAQIARHRRVVEVRLIEDHARASQSIERREDLRR